MNYRIDCDIDLDVVEAAWISMGGVVDCACLCAEEDGVAAAVLDQWKCIFYGDPEEPNDITSTASTTADVLATLPMLADRWGLAGALEL